MRVLSQSLLSIDSTVWHYQAPHQVPSTHPLLLCFSITGTLKTLICTKPNSPPSPHLHTNSWPWFKDATRNCIPWTAMSPSLTFYHICSNHLLYLTAPILITLREQVSDIRADLPYVHQSKRSTREYSPLEPQISSWIRKLIPHCQSNLEVLCTRCACQQQPLHLLPSIKCGIPLLYLFYSQIAAQCFPTFVILTILKSSNLSLFRMSLKQKL